MTVPKVDILLPFWGDVELLKKAVESVQAQTISGWRLLVFDDCYPSEEPARYFSHLNDDRIVYHRHEKNLGITNNFNFALQAATAEHCVILGCDDIMLPDYLETALTKVNGVDFYQPSIDIINENGVLYLPLGDRIKRFLQPKRSGIYGGEKLAASICHGNWLYFPSILWKSESIKKYGFDPRYKIAEDMVLELSIIKNGGVMYFDTKTTFRYRRFAKSLSSVEKAKGGVRFDEEAEVYNNFAREFKTIGWNRAARAARLRITSRLHQLMS